MPSKIFCIPLTKFLTTFFSRSPKFFPFFASVVKFHENSLLGCPPVLHHAPVTAFLLLFWSFTYIFKKKTGPLGAPRVRARGRRTVRTPLCTPLSVNKSRPDRADRGVTVVATRGDEGL